MSRAPAPPFQGGTLRKTRELAAWHAAQVPEAALEPHLPIVDPHHHLYGTAADASHYEMADLVRDLSAGHRVVATVYVEAYRTGWRDTGPEHLRPVGEVERIVRLAPGPVETASGPCHVAAGIVARANLLLGDAVAQVLEAMDEAGQGRLRGVRHPAAHVGGEVGRHITAACPPRMLVDPAFRRGMAQLARRGLSYDCWVYHPQLPEVADLAAALPDATIVLNHVGGLAGVAEFAQDRPAQFARWQRDIRELARRPNVVAKVGGMGMLVFGFGFEHRERPPTSEELAQAWKPLVETCLEAFGPARCMLESNFPVDRQTCGYVQLWNAFKRLTASLSADERADLFHRTACRVYRLPPPA